MKIKKITEQNRRDFHAVYECEHCRHEVRSGGYDDSNFHQNVIPNMTCGQCGLKSGDNYRPLAPKYPAGYVV